MTSFSIPVHVKFHFKSDRRSLELKKRVWITWERQRRSVELAHELGCQLFVLDYEGIMRYPKCIVNTLLILLQTKPEILFVQNPSMILASLCSIYRIISKTPLVVDRHTTFLLNKPVMYDIKTIVFKFLHRLTIRIADITIVTTNHLASIVSKLKGRSIVLPDKLPILMKTKDITLAGKHNLLLVSSFAEDEPIEEVLEAIKNIGDDSIYLYVTGNFKKFYKSKYYSADKNIVFTGYVDDETYVNMLFAVDVVMVFTTADDCMLCGCYEAISAGKPLLTSKKESLIEYFEGAYFVENNRVEIANGITDLIAEINVYNDRILFRKEQLLSKWRLQHFNNLQTWLQSLETAN